MYKLPDTKEVKIEKERSIVEFEYQTNLAVKVMKKIKSDTLVRAWHIKINDDHYRLIQTRISRKGETISAYPATSSGSVRDKSYGKPLFEKIAQDWLVGLEYLIRYVEGEDITKLQIKDSTI